MDARGRGLKDVSRGRRGWTSYFIPIIVQYLRDQKEILMEIAEEKLNEREKKVMLYV